MSLWLEIVPQFTKIQFLDTSTVVNPEKMPLLLFLMKPKFKGRLDQPMSIKFCKNKIRKVQSIKLKSTTLTYWCFQSTPFRLNKNMLNSASDVKTLIKLLFCILKFQKSRSNSTIVLFKPCYQSIEEEKKKQQICCKK